MGLLCTRLITEVIISPPCSIYYCNDNGNTCHLLVVTPMHTSDGSKHDVSVSQGHVNTSTELLTGAQSLLW